MAEASSTEAKTEKKPKKHANKAPPPPPEDAGGVTAWRTWALVGAVLVGGVIAWKLVGSTYKGDIETVCNGEVASGFTMDKDMSKVTAYVRQHLATPEGNTFYSSLSDAKLTERAKKLQDEANRIGIRSCPAVASIEKISAAAEYRSDVQRLCSNSTFPHLGELDDDARLQKLEDWIDQQAKSPRTKELGAALRQGTPADRAKLLRDTATQIDVFSCEIAKTLEGPILPAKGKGPPVVRPYAEPQIIGVLKAEDLAKALAMVTPAMNQCYQAGIARKPDLEGKLALRFRVDPSGKVAGVQPAETTLPDKETAACIIQVIGGMDLPKNAGPLVTVLLPLELTTAGFALPVGAPPASIAAPATSGSAPGRRAVPPSPSPSH